MLCDHSTQVLHFSLLVAKHYEQHIRQQMPGMRRMWARHAEIPLACASYM